MSQEEHRAQGNSAFNKGPRKDKPFGKFRRDGDSGPKKSYGDEGGAGAKSAAPYKKSYGSESRTSAKSAAPYKESYGDESRTGAKSAAPYKKTFAKKRSDSGVESRGFQPNRTDAYAKRNTEKRPETFDPAREIAALSVFKPSNAGSNDRSEHRSSSSERPPRRDNFEARAPRERSSEGGDRGGFAPRSSGGGGRFERSDRGSDTRDARGSRDRGSFAPRGGGGRGRTMRDSSRGFRRDHDQGFIVTPPTQGQIDHLMGLAEEAKTQVNGFSLLAIEPILLGALKSLEFETPTEIQASAIPKALEGNDILGCAQTGTGKTLAFCIPILNRLLKDPNGKAIILVPTRELGLQIEEVLKNLMKKIGLGHPVLLIGGVSYVHQFRQLKGNYRVIIATPGRLIDHLHQETIDLSKVDGLVLDEADRMLDVGFKPQLNEIVEFLPKERHTMMFTATLSKDVRVLVEKYLNKPMLINSGETSKPNEKIQQKMFEVDFSKKTDKILEILKENTGTALLFVKTQIKTEKVAQSLREFGVNAEPIHGGLTQGQRKRAIDSFRRQDVRVLVATDVASRGLDIDHVGLVINYDLPFVIEDYVHRIGRTGRAGREGLAISLVSRDDRRLWMLIARKYLSGQAELQLSPSSGGGGGGRSGGRSGGRDYSRGRSGGGGYGGRGGGGSRDGGGFKKSWK